MLASSDATHLPRAHVFIITFQLFLSLKQKQSPIQKYGIQLVEALQKRQRTFNYLQYFNCISKMFLSTAGMPSRTQLQPPLLLHGVIDKAPAITVHRCILSQCDRFRCKLRHEQKELPLRNDCYWLTITVKNNRETGLARGCSLTPHRDGDRALLRFSHLFLNEE